MNKRKIGNEGEDIATEYLENMGMRIVDRNYYTDRGEIDIVFKDKEYLVFCEVKYRGQKAAYNPLEAVTKAKQRSIVRTARVYLYEHGISQDCLLRFDCIGITEDRIEWIKDAFHAF